MAAWISDGSSEISSTGAEVTCSEQNAPGNNVYNALWDDGEGGVSSGQHYWKLDCNNLAEQKSLFVGVTDKDKFKQGWTGKGLLYGRNLSSGGALLVEGFGPSITSGDKVGVFVSFENDNIKVTYDLNDKSLGLAFDVPKSTLGALYPVVQFGGEGCVKIAKLSEQPPSPSPTAQTGIEGDWTMLSNEFKVNGANQPLPNTSGKVNLSIVKKEAGYSVNIKVVNSLIFSMEQKDGQWTTGPAASTKMYGGPEAAAFEGQMNQLKSNPSKIEVDGDGTTLIWENTTESMVSKWERSARKPPVTTNPFN